MVSLPEEQSVRNFLLDAALEYARRRWSIIPVNGKKARGLWAPFQLRAPDERTLRRMFSKPNVTGLAVILGPVSGGLACRDWDYAACYHEWAGAHADLAATLPTVQTARGFHVYFLSPDVYEALNDGEYRGDSGHYCLLPPSLHPGGALYRWIVPLPDGDLPSVDPVEVGLLPTQIATHADTQAHSTHSLHVSTLSVDGAIRATLPTEPGQRNRRLFDLARQLKAIMPKATMDELEPIVRAWHARALLIIRTKDWLVTWIDFRIAWARVKKPAGATMAKILETAAQGFARGTDPIAKLVSVCRTLQESHGPGRTWPLSCRLAALVMGTSHTTAAAALKLLVVEKVIELTNPGGSKGSGLAAEYRYLRDQK